MEKSVKTKKKIHWSRFIPVYILALPGFIYLIINNYLPMFGIVIAFKDLDFKKGLIFSPWAGLKNFEYLFSEYRALQCPVYLFRDHCGRGFGNFPE